MTDLIPKGPCRHVQVSFNELDVLTQESLITTVYESLIEAAEAEGKEFLDRDWHDPKPTTWQEAYAREYAIESIMWQDYVDGKDERDPDFVWETRVEEHIRHLAQTKLEEAFRHLEIEVAL